MIPEDTHEQIVAELQQEYEDLEQRYWILAGILIGFITYSYFHSWIVSISTGLIIYFVAWKYLAKKPFTSGIKQD